MDGMSISSVNLDLRGCMLLRSLGFWDLGDVSGKMEEFFSPTKGIDLSVYEGGGRGERVVVAGGKMGNLERKREREGARERGSEGESETL